MICRRYNTIQKWYVYAIKSNPLENELIYYVANKSSLELRYYKQPDMKRFMIQKDIEVVNAKLIPEDNYAIEQKKIVGLHGSFDRIIDKKTICILDKYKEGNSSSYRVINSSHMISIVLSSVLKQMMRQPDFICTNAILNDKDVIEGINWQIRAKTKQ